MPIFDTEKNPQLNIATLQRLLNFGYYHFIF
jgi:hypothetical protein